MKQPHNISIKIVLTWSPSLEIASSLGDTAVADVSSINLPSIFHFNIYQGTALA